MEIDIDKEFQKVKKAYKRKLHIAEYWVPLVCLFAEPILSYFVPFKFTIFKYNCTFIIHILLDVVMILWGLKIAKRCQRKYSDTVDHYYLTCTRHLSTEDGLKAWTVYMKYRMNVGSNMTTVTILEHTIPTKPTIVAEVIFATAFFLTGVGSAILPLFGITAVSSKLWFILSLDFYLLALADVVFTMTLDAEIEDVYLP